MRPIDIAFSVLKADPRYQMFEPAYPLSNLAEERYDDEGFDAGDGNRALGTIHPAIFGMLQRLKRQNKFEYGDLPNLNLDAFEPPRRSPSGYQISRDPPAGLLEGHPERYADSMPYGSIDDPMDQSEGYKNPDNKRRTQLPQTYSYLREYPTDEEVSSFSEDYSPDFQSIFRNTVLGRRAAERPIYLER